MYFKSFDLWLLYPTTTLLSLFIYIFFTYTHIILFQRCIIHHDYNTYSKMSIRFEPFCSCHSHFNNSQKQTCIPLCELTNFSPSRHLGHSGSKKAPDEKIPIHDGLDILDAFCDVIYWGKKSFSLYIVRTMI